MSLGLFGEFRHTMDDKGRVSLPASFRKALPETVVLVPGPENQVNVFSREGFEEWKKELFESGGGFKLNDRDSAKLRIFINSKAKSVDVDSAGRISVPKELREKAKLEKDVVIIGDEDHASLWNADKWEEYIGDFDLSQLYG